MPKFLAEGRTERGERNRAGWEGKALTRFGEGSGPGAGPLRRCAKGTMTPLPAPVEAASYRWKRQKAPLGGPWQPGG